MFQLIVITIVSQPHANFIIFLGNAPAYCDYDCSYNRSSVIVQATGINPLSTNWYDNKFHRGVMHDKCFLQGRM